MKISSISLQPIATLVLIGVGGISSAADTTITSWPSGISSAEIKKSSDILSTPSGWTSPASGQTQPTPPSTIPTGTWFTPYGCVSGVNNIPSCQVNLPNPTDQFFTTRLDACVWIANYANTNNTAVFYSNPQSNGGATCSYTATVVSNGYTGIGYGNITTSYCGPGYTYSNGSCVLQTATKVVKPSNSVCTIIQLADDTYIHDNGGGINGGDSDCTDDAQNAVKAMNDRMIGDPCCETVNASPAIDQ